MLSIQRASSHSGKCTPNLLPCRIEHNGPVNAADRYWRPEEQGGASQDRKYERLRPDIAFPDGMCSAHFRGRKLCGRKLQVPDGYRGAVLNNTSKILPQSAVDRDADVDEESEDQHIEVRVMEEVGEFDEVVVWGHEVAPDETEDPYSKGISEWISFAEAVHSTPTQKDAANTSD